MIRSCCCTSTGCQRTQYAAPRAAGKSRRCAVRVCATSNISSEYSQRHAAIAAAADPLAPPATPVQGAGCWAPTAATILVSLGLVSFLLRVRVKKPAVFEELDVDVAVKSSSDPLHHQRVLAKARQAAHIRNAIAYQKTGELIKAMLELNKALASNSICRTPAVVTHTKDELVNLYCLHLAHTEQPPHFATLLQLQEMLGITQDEAAQLEAQVLHSPGAFAI